MKLSRGDHEFAHFTFANLEPDTATSAQFGSGDWHALAGTGLTRTILIAGPDDLAPGDAVVVPSSCEVRVRFDDNPEQFTRAAGRITLI